MLMPGRRAASLRMLIVVCAGCLSACASDFSVTERLDAGAMDGSISDAAGDAADANDGACQLVPTATLPAWDGPAPPHLAQVYNPVAGTGKYHNELEKGTDLQRLELSAPDALCNDGTHAQLYVRPATPGNEKKWVLYLQGGGGCVGHAECSARWQGTQDGGYDATKMSTRYNPDTALAEGMFERSARNPVGGWNQVYFYYCSSDAFSGTNANAILFDPTNSAAKPFSLRFLGRRILEGAIEQLKNGAAATLKDSPGVVAYNMPALKDAETVILAGSSAGAAAVRRNVDWLATKFNPSVNYTAIAEATVTTPAGRYGGARGIEFDECSARNDYAERERPNSHLTAFDESCKAAHEPTGDAWRCFDTHHVLHHHITTPLLLRHDLTDPKAVSLPKLAGITLEQWIAVQNEYFQTLVNRVDFDHEPERIARAPSFFAPNCGAHIVFHKDSYYQHQVKISGAEVSMNDAVTRWLKGEPAFYAGDLSGTSSVCTK